MTDTSSTCNAIPLAVTASEWASPQPMSTTCAQGTRRKPCEIGAFSLSLFGLTCNGNNRRDCIACTACRDSHRMIACTALDTVNSASYVHK